MKKRNAAELEQKYGKPSGQEELPREQKGLASFPQYEEYEKIPGKDPKIKS